MAVMGSNLARNLANHGYSVAVYNITTPETQQLIDEHSDEGTFIPAQSLQDFVMSLERPRRAILLIRAGKPVDEVIEALSSLMEPGDIIVDGGNSLYTDDFRREALMANAGIHFVGCGVSGGEEGALNGPSIMPGGSEEAYKALGPILETIAAHVDGTPCCAHIGPDGAGHFVKMVHNGIEYADMQLIGETYQLLRDGLGFSASRIADIFREWNKGSLNSYLIEITSEVLEQVDAQTGLPLVDIIHDAAGQKGTGRWTSESALELGIPVTAITEAVFARALSSQAAQRQACQNMTAGTLSSQHPDPEAFIQDVQRALYASKIVAYAQGFDQIRAASDQYQWNVQPGTLATIWRGGCIIRAQFLDRIKEAYEKNPDITSLLIDNYFADALSDCIESWRKVIVAATELGIPIPAFSSALSYYDGLRSSRLPAALIQGQRDFFGAHTYRRIDRPGSFHTLWSGDRSEVEINLA